MALNPDYVLAPSLQMYFVDKDTGLPLVGGFVYFFKDQARSIPKPVFELVTAMPGGPYTYSQLPDPVELSSVGTFQDNDGNDILPYYFPFDSDGNVELYYIEVYDANGVLQFTREAWPNFVVDDIATDQDVTNFVPNGQFLLHTNIPATPANDNTAGKVSEDTTDIAQGGWTFDVTDSTVTTDFVTFQRYPFTQSPTGNPRYAVVIQTSVSSASPIKDLRLKFPDVNEFGGTQDYNLYFEGESQGGTDLNNCQVVLIKNYGSGGSATTEEIIATFSLTQNAITKQNITINFGINSNKTIGDLDDDYLQIAIRMPANATFTVLFTNFCLTIDSEQVSSFPVQTNAQQIDPSTAGWFPTPDHDGFDLYLPAVLGKEGLLFDDSSIGEIVAEANNLNYTGSVHNASNKLLCDGSQHLSSDYSPLGIPYARLRDKLLNSAGSIPIYGTGLNFVTGYFNAGNTAVMRLDSNKPAAIASFLNFATAVPTNFTATIVHGGADYSVQGFSEAQDSAFWIRTPTIGASFAVPSAGTSGWNVESVHNTAQCCSLIHVTNVTNAAGIANPGGAGKYFKFSNITTTYYVWFQITNETDPAPGGTGIKINLLSTDTARDVSEIVTEAVNGYEMWNITMGNAASFANSAWFSFNANNATSYYVWYNIDGAGIDPAPGGFTYGIEVPVFTGDPDTQIVSQSIAFVNRTYFATPDLRGVFLRGFTGTSTKNYDPGYANRVGTNSIIVGNLVGSFEFDEIYSHTHSPLGGGDFVNDLAAGVYGAGAGGGQSATTTAIGASESRPINSYVNYAIRY